MLRIENLTKSYKKGKPAVKGLSLHVEAGDIYGFIGHNGAGKTTTIRAVIGALDFEEGDIFIDGHSIKDDPIYCKSVTAYIPDTPAPYEFLTGAQYLAFIGDIFGVDPVKREELVEEYTRRFEIDSVLDNLISSYSHGMKQKLVVTSALIHSPKLLVLDEPFVGLDPKASHNLKQIMREKCEEGCAVFFSTHVLDVAEKLCNKIAVIKNGELFASGNMEDIIGSVSLEEYFLEVIDDGE